MEVGLDCWYPMHNVSWFALEWFRILNDAIPHENNQLCRIFLCPRMFLWWGHDKQWDSKCKVCVVDDPRCERCNLEKVRGLDACLPMWIARLFLIVVDVKATVLRETRWAVLLIHFCVHHQFVLDTISLVIFNDIWFWINIHRLWCMRLQEIECSQEDLLIENLQRYVLPWMVNRDIFLI